MKTDKPRTIRPDFWLVQFDQTKDWHLDEALMKHVERIVQVRLMDRNEVTHLCEITPSYCLYPVYTEAVFKNGLDDGSPESERLRDAIDQEIQQHQDLDPKYFHCRVVEGRLEECAPGKIHHIGDTGVSFEDCPYDEQVQAQIEHYNCNHVL